MRSIQLTVSLTLMVATMSLSVVGCAGSRMDRLDRQVDRLIQMRQQQDLGGDRGLDPERVPAPSDATPTGRRPPASAYDRTPPTDNPAAADLPVTPATPAGPATPASPGDPGRSPAASDPSTTGEAQSSDGGGGDVGGDGGGDGPDADVRSMGLEEVLGYAVAHGRDYRSRKEDLFLSALSLLSEQHLWGPRFFDTFTAQIAGTPEAGDHEQALSLVNELRVTQRLPYGGEVSVRALVNYVSRLQQVSTATEPDDEQSGDVIVSLTQPLLRGAGQTARESLTQAHRNLIYAAREFEGFRRSYLVDVASDYFDLLRQQAQIENQQRQLANLAWLRRRIEALARAGREPYFEVQRAQQQELFAQNNLLNAREAYERTLDAFKVTIGMPIGQRVRIVATEVVVAEPVLAMEAAVSAAGRYRLDLQTTRDRVDDARRRVAHARNSTLPDLDAFASVSLPTDSSQRYGGSNLQAGEGTYSAGLRLDAPLDRRREWIDYRRALVDADRSQRSYDLSRDRVSLEVRRAIRQIEQARFTLDLQERNIAIAEKRLRGVVLRLRTLGPRDFIEAQDDLLEARNRRDAAVRDLRVSVLSFLRDTGQLRVTSRGQWQPPGTLASAVPPPPMPAAPEMLQSPHAEPAPANPTTPATSGSPDASPVTPATPDDN